MPKSDGTTPNASVENAFAVLRLISGASEPLTLNSMATDIGLPLSTAHRVVTTLCDTEYLTQQYSGGPYATGIRVRELLNALYDRYPIRRRATRTLRVLADTTHQAAVLYVRFGGHCLRIAGAQDRQQIHRPLLIGETLSLAESPCGLMMSAFGGSGEKAKASRKSAREGQLRQIRRDGYLVTTAGGLRSVNFPLLDPDGRAFATISLEGSTLELREPSKTKLKTWARIVKGLQEVCDQDPGLSVVPFSESDTEPLLLENLE